MTIALWTVNSLLALAFLAAGGMKVSRKKDDLVKAGMGWAETYSDTNVKLIGLAEVVGAIGLVLPFALDIAPVLTPIAAVCLAIIMAGAVATHMRRHESPAGAGMLAAVSVVSAVIGFIVVL